jgi:acetyl-CoA C-acetyltransferase
MAPVPDSFEDIFGTTTVGQYALVAQRHMHQYGTTSEQLAEIAVATRKHAGLNPSAMYRDPITIDDVINSRMISTPLHLLDCCVISDGAGAVVVAAPEVARNCRKKPVWVLSTQEAIEHTALGKHDFTLTCARRTGPLALQQAGVTHDDIDMAMIYDSFTITVLCTLEDLGFCNKGEGGDFVSGGRLQLGGALPINTDGGALSSNHPGMRGIFLLIEGTIQARGEGGLRQVPNCQVVLCHGTGGTIGVRHAGATAVLARD